MKVQVRLFASLKKYLPAGAGGDTLTVELPPGATVADLTARLGIPPEHAKMIVSENTQLDSTAPVRDGQQVQMFPPLAGGR